MCLGGDKSRSRGNYRIGISRDMYVAGSRKDMVYEGEAQSIGTGFFYDKIVWIVRSLKLLELPSDVSDCW